MATDYDNMSPGLTGVSKDMFLLTPSDQQDQPFRILEAVTGGTVVIVKLDGTPITRTVLAGQTIRCAARRINETGTTSGIVIYGYK